MFLKTAAELWNCNLVGIFSKFALTAVTTRYERTGMIGQQLDSRAGVRKSEEPSRANSLVTRYRIYGEQFWRGFRRALKYTNSRVNPVLIKFAVTVLVVCRPPEETLVKTLKLVASVTRRRLRTNTRIIIIRTKPHHFESAAKFFFAANNTHFPRPAVDFLAGNEESLLQPPSPPESFKNRRLPRSRIVLPYCSRYDRLKVTANDYVTGSSYIIDERRRNGSC